MGILVLAALILLVVVGLERNARRTRRQLPAAASRFGFVEVTDRDTERVLAEAAALSASQSAEDVCYRRIPVPRPAPRRADSAA
ncbi:hypothetical protein [Streptacidiphilus monticola]|uniref:Uncharacterized protein n=1 Tax=Streptacidiphilus monticola TaxID=2161674 RepID=A0ABW1G7M2_9ACTN